MPIATWSCSECWVATLSRSDAEACEASHAPPPPTDDVYGCASAQDLRNKVTADFAGIRASVEKTAYNIRTEMRELAARIEKLEEGPLLEQVQALTTDADKDRMRTEALETWAVDVDSKLGQHEYWNVEALSAAFNRRLERVETQLRTALARQKKAPKRKAVRK